MYSEKNTKTKDIYNCVCQKKKGFEVKIILHCSLLVSLWDTFQVAYSRASKSLRVRREILAKREKIFCLQNLCFSKRWKYFRIFLSRFELKKKTVQKISRFSYFSYRCFKICFHRVDYFNCRLDFNCLRKFVENVDIFCNELCLENKEKNFSNVFSSFCFLGQNNRSVAPNWSLALYIGRESGKYIIRTLPIFLQVWLLLGRSRGLGILPQYFTLVRAGESIILENKLLFCLRCCAEWNVILVFFHIIILPTLL